MADKRISELDAVTTPAPTDEFPVVQSGNTRKMTREQIHTLESGEQLSGALYDDGGAVINAKHPDYGAEGDGATDDATALAAALTAAAGGTLVLPAGTYLCSAALTVDTARTHIRGEGDVVVRFTAATNGIHITAQRCRLSNITLEAGHSGCLTGVLLNGTPAYAVLDNVIVRRQTDASWDTGWDLENAQNLTALGGWIDAHTGGTGGTITNAIVVQDEARGNSFFGVSITGRNNAGEFTSRGLYVQDGGGIRWFGGVIQGGFDVAAVDVDGGLGGSASGSTAVSLYHPHIEISDGGGVGFQYDDCVGAMLVVSPDGGSVSIGPTAAAWDFELRGGLVGDVTVDEFSRHALVWPGVLSGTLTVDDSATGTIVGPYRTSGGTVRRSFLLNRGSAAGELLQLDVDERSSSGQTDSPELLWTARTHDGTDPFERTFRAHVAPSSDDGDAEWRLATRLDGGGFTTRFGVDNFGTVRMFGNLTPDGDGTRNLGGDSTGFKQMYLNEFWEGTEMSDPSAPGTNEGRLYFRDNGAGKTQLVVRFNTGAIQVIATEP